MSFGLIRFFFYVKKYARQADGSADGKRSPSPRDMYKHQRSYPCAADPKRERKGKGRVEGWDKKRSRVGLEELLFFIIELL